MSDIYEFGVPKDDTETYIDGTIVPHRHQDIYRIEPIDSTTTKRVLVGYIEIHLHKVKRDILDVEDISAGITVRINPKVG